MKAPQTSSCPTLCCLSFGKAVSGKVPNGAVLYQPLDAFLLFYLFSIHLFKTNRWAFQPRQRHPSIRAQQRSSAQIPKSDLLGWHRCNKPAASSTFFPSLSQATETTKEAWQIREKRKTSHFRTASNKAVLFTCSGTTSVLSCFPWLLAVSRGLTGRSIKYLFQLLVLSASDATNMFQFCLKNYIASFLFLIQGSQNNHTKVPPVSLKSNPAFHSSAAHIS